MEASGAAALAENLLAPARGTLIAPLTYPAERDVSAEAPRIGVFVCHCGSNIGGFLDVPSVAEYARTLPHVVHAEDNLYTCSQDSIRRIIEQTQSLGLNRVVVASCTPLTHGSIFQDSIRQAGLNPFLFEMANIRNQCSWVHSHDNQVATEKAKELVRMAVARAARLEPLYRIEVPVTKRALVIGGGVAGMHAALALAGQEIAVDLVEREAELGGNLRYVHFLVEDPITSSPPQLAVGEPSLAVNDPGPLPWRDAQAYLWQLVEQVNTNPHILVHLETQLLQTQGYRGNFSSVLRTPAGEITILHGATIVAVGAQEYRGSEYGYGDDPRILTQQEFEALLAEVETSKAADEPSIVRTRPPALRQGQAGQPALPLTSQDIVMIQCVGPAEQYCSRTCCTVALKNALKLKQINPAAKITILYRDIRTYGFKERLYTEARRTGILFIRYDAAHKPAVRLPGDGKGRASSGEPLEI